MTNLQHSVSASLIAVCSFYLICWMKLNKQKLKVGFHTLFVVVDVNAWGAGIAQWLERRTRDRKERRENFLLQGQLSVLTLISVSVPPPCYRSST